MHAPIYISEPHCVTGTRLVHVTDLYPGGASSGFETALSFNENSPNPVIAMLEAALRRFAPSSLRAVDRVLFTSTKLESLGLAGHFELQRLASRFGLPLPLLPLFGYGCAGMVGALHHHLGENERVLWLSADHRGFSDRRLLEGSALMGDAAGGCIFSPHPSEILIRDVLFSQDGSFHEVELAHAHWNSTYFFRMNGLTRSILQRNGLAIQDVDHILPHFTNRNAWSALQSILRFSDDQIVSDPIGKVGHLYGLDPLYGLNLLRRDGRLHKGDVLLFLAVGLGASFGAVLMEAA